MAQDQLSLQDRRLASPIDDFDFEQRVSKKGITVLEPEPDQEREERRLRKRYPISTLARFRWQDSSGTWFSNSGKTLNVSVSGVYILTAASPPMGAPIEVKVALSAPSIAAGRGYLSGKGVVIRVNSEEGFAAQINLRMLRAQASESTAPE